MSESASTPREVAFRVVSRVDADGAWANLVIERDKGAAELDRRDRAFVTALIAVTLQRQITLDHLIEKLADRPAASLQLEVRTALRLGMAQVLFMDGVADHAAVSESVDLVEGRGQRGFVNAILRRAVRERAALLKSLRDKTPEQAAITHGMPLWIVDRWWAQFGPERAREILAPQNEVGETALRPNRLLVDSAEARRLLEAAGVGLTEAEWPAGALLATGPLDRTDSNLLRAVVVQARGAQLAASLTDLNGGEQVLELCAAPGGKTLALAEAVGQNGSVVAVEAHAGRAKRLAERLKLMGAADRVTVRHGDAREADGTLYDAVLVDPPCSALGILRSRPDRRHHARAEELKSLVRMQREIAATAVASLRPGGTFIWCTCTTTVEENESILRPLVEAGLLEQHGTPMPEEFEAMKLPALDGGLMIPPLRGDGFVIARLQRTERPI
ncbi:MAG: hypothetical protein NT122_08380 [Solirubrobacterales bacterium]|nr:hypothetical protein [Solirubrobacterales bacterium]